MTQICIYLIIYLHDYKKQGSEFNMLGVIKTAIITIVISFISGLLLDYYKNLAPRLLCRVGDAIPMNLEGKKVFAYIVTIVNVSNKIIMFIFYSHFFQPPTLIFTNILIICLIL